MSASEILKTLTPELMPIALKALNALLSGQDARAVLTQAERDVLAAAAHKALDEALGPGGNP